MPTATFASKPKTRIRIGVISEPPPIPVMPTRIPTSRPARESCQVIARGNGQETKGRPVRRQPSLYASQPVQNPVAAASSARPLTSSASAVPATSEPSAYASVEAASTTAPTMFATRGGRLSSSGPSPKRGCTSSK